MNDSWRYSNTFLLKMKVMIFLCVRLLNVTKHWLQLKKTILIVLCAI